jgi:hypothetical protein
MLLTLLGLLVSSAAADPAALGVPAPISSVTVHSGQARVVRTASLTLQGSATIELPALPASADPASVRLEAEGPAEVVHIALSREDAGDQPGGPTQAGPEALADLDQAIAAATGEQEVFEQLAGASGWKPAVPDQPSRVDPRGWQRAVTFLENFAARMHRQQRAVEGRLQELRERRARQLKAQVPASSATGRGWRVVATVQGAGPAKLRLGYLVQGARWIPSYDVRLDARGERVTMALSGLVSQESGEDWQDAALLLSTAVPATITTVPRLKAWRLGAADQFRPAPAAARRLPAASDPTAKQGAIPGTLAVFVFDEGGNPLGGVRLQAGNATGYTDEQGFRRLQGLAVGSYQLRASAPKLGEVIQPLTLGPDGGEANIVMEVKTQAEEVMVMERAPMVSTTSARVRQTLSFDPPHHAPATAPATGARGARGARPARGLSALAATAPGSSAGAPPPPGTAAALSGGNAVTFAVPSPETIASGGQRKVALQAWTWAVAVERVLVPGLGPDSFLVAAVKSDSPRPLPGGRATLFVGDDPAGNANIAPVAPGARFTLPLGVDRAVRMIRQVTVQTRHSGLFFWKRDIDRHRVTLEVSNPHAHPLRLSIKDQVPVSGDDRVAVKLVGSRPAAQVDRDTGTLAWRLTLPAGASTTLSFEYELGRPSGEQLSQEDR